MSDIACVGPSPPGRAFGPRRLSGLRVSGGLAAAEEDSAADSGTIARLWRPCSRRVMSASRPIEPNGFYEPQEVKPDGGMRALRPAYHPLAAISSTRPREEAEKGRERRLNKVARGG